MTSSPQYVVFTLDDQRYALVLEAIERVEAIVNITPLQSLVLSPTRPVGQRLREVSC